MSRIDDYITARRIAVEALRKESFATLLSRSGFEREAANLLRAPFLNRVYRIGYPAFEFEDLLDSIKKIPIQEQILILHYMSAPGPTAVTGKWISYREIPGASFYFNAFVKRAIDPLKNVFGRNPDALKEAAHQLNGTPIRPGDVGVEFDVLPKVPVQIILYAGDEEFAAEANILFDQAIGAILSPEDVAWLAGILVYRLIALSTDAPQT